jgi:hypothetical protein
MSERSLKEAEVIHVVGGGCFGSQYVRWLLRAREKGMARFAKIVAIDRDPDCRLLREGPHDPVLEIARADWVDYFSELLLRGGGQEDQWVPAPLSPHILFLGFLKAARKARKFREGEFREAVPPPVQVPLTDGNLAVSFAEWQCPVNCIEPPNCPAIHAPRTWDMKSALREHFHSQESWRSVHVLQCRHWVHGVGTIPMRDIFEEFRKMLKKLDRPETREVVVATTSGCHGLISRATVTSL